MITTIVNVTVKPECITDFIAASRRNHLASVQELGNMRFDVCQNAQDPALFVLYEAYESEAAAAAHKATAHYAQWRDTVAPMMAAPRQGVKYNVLCPEIG